MRPGDTFSGQVALITGGGTGLGLAMGRAFAQFGAIIVIASRNPDHRNRGCEAIARDGGHAVGVALDVRDRAAVAQAFDAAEARAGPVGILVNHAAGNFPVRAEALSANGWRAVSQIVLDGSFFCAQQFHARAVAHGAEGTVLNILATFVEGGAPGHVHSAAAKSGVRSLTETLTAEWAPDRIRVSTIAPGFFPNDDLSADMLQNRPDGDEAEWRRIPAQRTGRLQEPGGAATWLCSPYARFFTGHMLVIDGGERLNHGIRKPEFVPIRDRIPDRRSDQ